MYKFLFILILAVLIVTIILYGFSRFFLHMPRALQFKSKKEYGMWSSEWMEWMENSGTLGQTIYDFVVPRKTRQEYYAHSHQVHFCAVINDKFYNTDSATEFLVQYTKFLGYTPCAKHYYRTPSGEFFSITATLGKKDQFNIIPEKEMKRLLRDEPTLYATYIPHASEDKDLREYSERKKREEEEEAKKKEQAATDTEKKETKSAKKKGKLPSNNPFKKWVKQLKENTEQKVAPDVDDKNENSDKEDIQTTLLDDSVKDNEDKEILEKTVATEDKNISNKSANLSESQTSDMTLSDHENDSRKKLMPENTVSEDMDALTDIFNVYNEPCEADAEQYEADKNKKLHNSERKNKKNDNKEEECASPQKKVNGETAQSVNKQDNAKTKKEQKNKNEDEVNVANASCDNVSKKSVVTTPKKKRQKRKGSQMTDLPNDIGYDNVSAVEKQQKLENMMFEEPIQEETQIEEALKKEEEKQKEKEKQEKLENLDKAASNMNAMKYRTVSKEE